ncbi:recombination mediator RecR [Miniphocaeibacter halophilus]|uniref:Recombination protein RecR n=1 Tax=Miniphocaeibacter halophilus TaxID=2931922 RepID=A0AC61MS84_9FIRM|nr:recombination mediator RecR [Miniphocaeibacter halophilus]QQK08312.1 recombination protein RecR [Miniphocaeibacter halophilus]
MALYPRPIENLIVELASLPTIGRKSAKRLAFKIIEMDDEKVNRLVNALINVKKEIHHCKICGNLTDKEICDICSDESRDKSTIVVVEDSSNIISLEKAREYKGQYHVLNGLISPRENISPEDLNIESLIERVKDGGIDEVILSLSPTVDGDLTINFLSEIIKPLGVKVTKIANGVPLGVSLEYFDEMSIYKALEDRREI